MQMITGNNSLLNLSTSIYRQGNTGMSGITIPPTAYNLANGQSGPAAEIQIPQDVSNPASITALNTSLWSFSQLNANNHTNGLTMIMTTIDRPGIGNYYYAIRAASTVNITIAYGNIRMSAIKLSS